MDQNDRETIGRYFSNITFSKVDRKEDYAIYGASINSSFGSGKKEYVLLFVPNHMAILDRGKISDLHWKSLQTRILTNGYRLPSQKWDIPRGTQLPMFSVVERTDERSKYKLEGSKETEMILKHDPKKKTKFQYHNRINLVAALSTFMCILVINDETKFSPETMSPYTLYPPNTVPQSVRKRYEPEISKSVHLQVPVSVHGSEKEEDSFLPKIVCNDKYCYYESPSGTATPIKGYLPMGVSYGFGEEINENNKFSSEMSNKDRGVDDSFELL